MQSLTGSGHLQQFPTKGLSLEKNLFWGAERWSRIGGGRLRETVVHVSITPSVSCYLHLNVFHEKKKTMHNRNQKTLYCTFYITIQYNFNPGQNFWDILCFFFPPPPFTVLGVTSQTLLHILHTLRTSTLFRGRGGGKSC